MSTIDDAEIKMTVLGRERPGAPEAILCEELLTAAALADGTFEAQLAARAAREGWVLTALCRRTPRDQLAYEEKLQLAAEFGAEKARPVPRDLLLRFGRGEVTEDLLFALGRAVLERAHPATEFALKAAERDVYRVWWRARLGPRGVSALMSEAETWAEMALDWRAAAVAVPAFTATAAE
jgi:hypothetical protein